MNVTRDHWLSGVIRAPLHGGSLMGIRRFLVIHFTDGATADSSISWWRNPRVKGANAHVVIDRDGTIYQCRPFDRTCGHAGESRWRDPKTGKLFTGLNACAIGIELANGGRDEPGPVGFDWAKQQPGFRTITARHKHGGPVAERETYPPTQLATCEAVARALVRRYHLDDVIGLEDCSPGRKTDPGPAFPMAQLRQSCGFSA